MRTCQLQGHGTMSCSEGMHDFTQGIEKQFVHRTDQESLNKEEVLHLYMKK